MVQQQQYAQDPQMLRQYGAAAEQPTQGFEYAYNGDMVAAENPSEMEDEQGRFFSKVSEIYSEVLLSSIKMDFVFRYFAGKGLQGTL